MKSSFLLYVLIIASTFSCNNSANGEKTEALEVKSSEKIETTGDEEEGSIIEEVDREVEELKAKVDEMESKEVEKEENTIVMDVFDPDYINGRWEAEDQNGYSFGAWFDSDEGSVLGQYCAMNHDASRIDCGTHEEVESCYLKSGPVKGKEILEIEVVSCYALKKGKATLTVQDDGHLIWRLVESPGVFKVDHFAPEVALLRKVSIDPFE